MSDIERSVLGKTVGYPEVYDPGLLQSILRQTQRDFLGLSGDALPFVGWDILNHYEISYLLTSGKPEVGILEIYVPAQSPYLVESKSLKLYFNSLNMHKFSDSKEFLSVVQRDLDHAYGQSVKLKLIRPAEFNLLKIKDFSGIYLDGLEVNIGDDCRGYLPESALLVSEGEGRDAQEFKETLYSNLLKSNCLITGQPDWASIQIYYEGPRINHQGLLKYLIAFRQHQEFHEHCIERIFIDILTRCQPTALGVFGRYTRRGGIDINPLRCSHPEVIKKLFPEGDDVLNIRHARQ
jgi:7-cyano-7-deazaguanine reductase